MQELEKVQGVDPIFGSSAVPQGHEAGVFRAETPQPDYKGILLPVGQFGPLQQAAAWFIKEA